MLLSVGTGILIAVVFVAAARWSHAERLACAAGLVLLPFVSVWFSLARGETSTAALELVAGLPFVVVGALALVVSTPLALAAVGLLWIAHAAFDFVHSVVLVNPAVPGWYLGVAAITNVAIGAYALWLAARQREASLRASDWGIPALLARPSRG